MYVSHACSGFHQDCIGVLCECGCGHIESCGIRRNPTIWQLLDDLHWAVAGSRVSSAIAERSMGGIAASLARPGGALLPWRWR